MKTPVFFFTYKMESQFSQTVTLSFTILMFSGSLSQVICLRESVSGSLSQSISESVSGRVVLLSIHNRKCHFSEAGRRWRYRTTWYQIHQSQPRVEEPRDIRLIYPRSELRNHVTSDSPIPAQSWCTGWNFPLLRHTQSLKYLELHAQSMCYTRPHTAAFVL